MARVTTALLLILVMVASAFALTPKEEQIYLSTNDAAMVPQGPVAIPPTDNPWDTLFTLNAQGVMPSHSQLLLGTAFAGGYFWVSGGGASSGVATDNKLYRFSPSGAFVDSIAQPTTTSGWGIRDIAFDGTYLYGGCEEASIFAWDPATGVMVPSMNVPRPSAVNPARALAYDPVNDHFWSGNFGSNLVEFDRSGAVIWSGSPTPLVSVYGMAWDSDPAGPWLWIYDQGSLGNECTLRKFNPTTHTMLTETHTVPNMLFGSTAAGIAGGCEMNNTWNPAFWTVVSLVQGTPNDYIVVQEVRANANPNSPAAPSAFSVANSGAALTAVVHWTNPTLTVGGAPLTSITNIIVQRNGSTVATLNGTPGQVMTYNDNVPSVGSYSYSVYATNAAGNGIPASGSAWIGLDVPAAPTGVTATITSGLNYTLTWTAPTAGAHGGYFPAGSWNGQKIYDNGTLIATLTGTNTSYNGSVPGFGTHTVGVLYYNNSGNGNQTNAAPLNFNPYIMSTVPFAWVEINPGYPGALPGTSAGLNSDDQLSAALPIGINFSFFGTTQTSVKMCSNMFATFTGTNSSYTNYTLPNTTVPQDMLAAYWDDGYMLSPPTNGTAWYYNDATGGRFIMEWDSVSHFSTTQQKFTFEIILYSNGNIDYMYKFINLSGIAPSASVGLQNTGGTMGVQATYNGSGPIEPASQTGIRFAVAGAAGSLDVTLTPINPPITVPAAGGQFSFNAAVRRVTGPQAPFIIWSRDMYPNGTFTNPLLGPVQINPPVGVNVARLRQQNVPGTWPAGVHTYIGYANTSVSYPAIDSSFFTWTKSATGNGPMVWDATCTGELFPGEVAASAPTTFIMAGAQPNPFNPTTTLSFALPEAVKVVLNVYDVQGRLVATLVNGLREAGQHSVTFDGANLASGIYLYSLTAGANTATGKMVLMK